ncbi:MAG TPA: hypothetical protein VLF68_05185 [Candidatus Saccharimonadales bacterium]|nr:hypothetical protein [Candidatus Saccharimonadales bacterium]
MADDQGRVTGMNDDQDTPQNEYDQNQDTGQGRKGGQSSDQYGNWQDDLDQEDQGNA